MSIDNALISHTINSKYRGTIETEYGGVGTIVGVGISVVLAATSFLYGCCPNRTRQTHVEPGIKVLNLTHEEAEFLEQYKVQGRPYLFQSPGEKELGGYYRRLGWDTENLTDAQFILLLRDADELASAAKGIK